MKRRIFASYDSKLRGLITSALRQVAESGPVRDEGVVRDLFLEYAKKNGLLDEYAHAVEFKVGVRLSTTELDDYHQRLDQIGRDLYDEPLKARAKDSSDPQIDLALTNRTTKLVAALIEFKVAHRLKNTTDVWQMADDVVMLDIMCRKFTPQPQCYAAVFSTLGIKFVPEELEELELLGSYGRATTLFAV